MAQKTPANPRARGTGWPAAPAIALTSRIRYAKLRENQETIPGKRHDMPTSYPDLNAKDLPAVMLERFGDAAGFVGRPKVAAAE